VRRAVSWEDEQAANFRHLVTMTRSPAAAMMPAGPAARPLAIERSMSWMSEVQGEVAT
jgi:hypothetical protein